MKQNEAVQRIGYLDMVRGLATFLVIWGHAIQYGGSEADFFQNKLFIFIYSFPMPLFLLISAVIFVFLLYHAADMLAKAKAMMMKKAGKVR